MNLPQTKEHRDKLNGYVNQIVDLMREKDTLDEEIKNVKDIVKEELDYSPKGLNLLVKARYDAAKLNDEIEVRKTALAEDEILLGKSEED